MGMGPVEHSISSRPIEALGSALSGVESSDPSTSPDDFFLDDLPVFQIGRTLDSVAHSIGSVEPKFCGDENLRVGLWRAGIDGRIKAGVEQSRYAANSYCGLAGLK